MKKALLIITSILLIIPLINAINLELEEQSSQPLIIMETDTPATFDLKITNKGESDEFRVFNLIGFEMEPDNSFKINKGESKDITIKFYPREINLRGYYGLQYFIKSNTGSSEQAERLTVKIIDLKDAFEIGASEINPESNSLNIYLHNKEKFNFGEMEVKFTSKFFSIEKEFNLGPNERKDFNINLNKEDIKQLVAGFYSLKAEIKTNGLTANTEGVINFLEKEILEEKTKEQSGIISIILIEKTNTGNTIKSEEIVVQKNIISRLFTGFTPEPDAVNRQGMKIYYTWKKDIRPGQSIQVRVKTNWFYPLLIIALIIGIIIFVKRIISTDVLIQKRVSYVKAKGGELALKVNLFISAKKYVERVNIVERIPHMMKIYEKFGGVSPSRINEEARYIEWDFEKMEQGEIRTISYIIYSKKVGLIGKFALPTATLLYQKEGKIKETQSNRTYFVAEQRRGDLGEN